MAKGSVDVETISFSETQQLSANISLFSVKHQ